MKPHRLPIFISVFVFLLLSKVAAPCAQSVMLAWDLNGETNLAGYKILSGPASGVYITTNLVPGRVSVGAVSNLPPGRTFFVVVATDTSGLDSDFSNEVSFNWTNRISAPKMFRVVGTMQASATPFGPWKDFAAMEGFIQTTNAAQFVRSSVKIEAVGP